MSERLWVYLEVLLASISLAVTSWEPLQRALHGSGCKQRGEQNVSSQAADEAHSTHAFIWA